MANCQSYRELVELQSLGSPLSGAALSRLREHLSGCDSCAKWSNRHRQTLRELSGVAASGSTGLERRLLFAEVLGQVDGAEQARSPAPGWSWRLVLAGTLAAALLVLVVAGPWRIPPGSPGSSDPGGIRGGEVQLPELGFGVSGVNREGSEYEVSHAAGVCFRDSLRFYLTSRTKEARYVFIFGIQDGADEPIWYFPSPEEGTSLPVPPRVSLGMIPDEILVEAPHRPGTLTILALFSSEPLSLELVSASFSNPRAWLELVGTVIDTQAVTLEIREDCEVAQ